jgi:HTH-type transcriptional regulator/antitoxin MqsA
MTSAGSTQALHRSRRPFVVTYRGMTVDLAGCYPDDCDEGIHVGDDMAVTDAALQRLKDEPAGEED